MTQDNYTDGNDAVDQSMDDSPVMKALRKQIKDLQSQVNAAPTRESIEAEIRAGLARESAISEQLIALGHPAGMSAFLNGQLGEAEVSRESVANALQSIGYQIEVDDAAQEQEVEAQANLSDLANVSRLSAQMQSITQPGREDNIAKVNAAQTPEELVELMRQQGLLTSQH